MARRTKEEAEATRRLLLQTALEKFSESGIHKTTLAQIASAAGLTRGAIYWHFKDKLEMLDALFNEVFQPIYQQFEIEIEKRAEQPFKVLENIACHFLSELINNPFMQQTLSLTIQVQTDSELNHRCRAGENEDRKVLMSLFQTAQMKGQLKEGLTIELAIFMYCSFLEGIVHSWLGDEAARKKKTLDEIKIKVIVETFIGSLQK